LGTSDKCENQTNLICPRRKGAHDLEESVRKKRPFIANGTSEGHPGLTTISFLNARTNRFRLEKKRLPLRSTRLQRGEHRRDHLQVYHQRGEGGSEGKAKRSVQNSYEEWAAKAEKSRIRDEGGSSGLPPHKWGSISFARVKGYKGTAEKQGKRKSQLGINS